MHWLLAGLTAAAFASATVLLVRRRRATMEQAWRSWSVDGPGDDRLRALRDALLAELTPEVRESVHGNLLEFESVLRRDEDPLQALRRELMDSVDRRLLNMEILELPPEVRKKLREQSSELLQSDAEARTYIAANEARLAVLREYAGLRFGDRVPGDWFDVYERASRLRRRGTRNFIQRTLNGTQTGEDDARYQSMTRVDREIRTRLLKVPAGTRFTGLDEGKLAPE
ncbi:MAG TPA: hypothetical protein VHP13_03560 [Gammaproteobacteria bacterium]|jgi:hypothetical protein|nr:hypothetical protein [Gammaproteobacteria bacterium]